MCVYMHICVYTCVDGYTYMYVCRNKQAKCQVFSVTICLILQKQDLSLHQSWAGIQQAPGSAGLPFSGLPSTEGP